MIACTTPTYFVVVHQLVTPGFQALQGGVIGPTGFHADLVR